MIAQTGINQILVNIFNIVYSGDIDVPSLSSDFSSDLNTYDF